ncbi:MAG: hypothetical protein ACFFB3_06090 [Candidatus Hodarchaeota archaeon]
MTAPVHSISIINEAGLPVVDISAEDALKDATLLAGLTSAIQAFASEFSGGRNIHSLDFEDYSLIYSPVADSKKGILCVRMSKEVADISEMTDIIMNEIIRQIQKAGTKEIEYQVVFDTTRDKFEALLLKFLELSYLNEILQPHGYSLRALNRSLCVVSTNGEESGQKGTCDYRHNLTEAEAMAVLEEILPKMSLAEGNTTAQYETTIISFPKIHRIGMGSFFPRQAPGVGKSAIIVLFDEIDQVSLYKHSPSLSKRLIETSDKLASQWPNTGLLPSHFQDLLMLGRFHIETKKRFDRDSVSFELLRKVSKKNLDRVIRNVIVGHQVVIATDDYVMGELVVRTLEAFALHRVTTIELRASKKSAANIVTTSRNHLSDYSDQDTVIMDLEKGKIMGGFSSKFCQSLLKSIQKKSRIDAISLVETEVNRIVTQATSLADLAQNGETQDERLKQFRSEVRDDSLEIITEIAAAANPLIRQGIRQTSEAISSVESYLAKF